MERIFDDKKLDSFYLNTYESYNNRIKGLDEISKVTLGNAISKIRRELLVELLTKIRNLNSIKREKEYQLQQNLFRIDLGTVKAPIEGKLNVIKKILIGDFMSTGELIATIVPDNINKYFFDSYISVNNVAKIKVGDVVKLNLVDFKRNEKRTIEAKVSYISPDVILEENGNYSYGVTLQLFEEILVVKQRILIV